MFTPLIHRLQRRCPGGDAVQIARQCLPFTPERLVQHLPALGDVLYMPMRSAVEQVMNLPQGYLVEAMPLAPMIRAHWLMKASMITVDGPREWMEWLEADGRSCARMYLLPDTDYPAWDALLGCDDRVPAFRAAVPASEPSPISAQILRFHTYPIAGLQVLGAELVTTVTTLSRDLAGRIARDEALPLRLVAS